jgi:hypothetical protein
MAKVAGSLLYMYEKHKEYLEKQIERCGYLHGKSGGASHHLARVEAYKLALDNLQLLFGAKE